MTTVADVTAGSRFAPSRLAEPWDNVGLLWGDPAAAVGAGHDLPDGHAGDGRRGDSQSGPR